MAAMLPPSPYQNDTAGKPRGLKSARRNSSTSSARRRSTGSLCRRPRSSSRTSGARYDIAGAGVSKKGRKNSMNRPRRSSSQHGLQQENAGDVADPGRDEVGTPGVGMKRSLQRRKKSSGGRKGSRSRSGRGRGTHDRLLWGERDGGGGDGDGAAAWSLSEEERTGIVTDLVELFQQVDHNGDQVIYISFAHV